MFSKADSRFAPSQWERVLLCNDVSHWLVESLKSALFSIPLLVFDSYPELFQEDIFSVADAVVVDTYHMLSLPPDSTSGMKVTSRVPHSSVHGLLLSNTTDSHVNCALDIVQKKRIDTLTAMHSQLNELEVSSIEMVCDIHQQQGLACSPSDLLQNISFG